MVIKHGILSSHFGGMGYVYGVGHDAVSADGCFSEMELDS